MGIPGLLKEIGKGERIALSKLAVEFLERNRRPIRIAIDIAIWQFQNQAGQGGQNPALRTFYYRLLRILALPVHPLFVYDGPKRPLAKRNRVVSRYATTSLQNEMSKQLLQLFRFPYRTAAGEAEAECALLQREGIVDAVMSQDVDAVMWGSTMTLRDWSQEGTRGNKTATHVNVLRAKEIRTNTGLDPDGMILVAILSGGDYAPEGIAGFGSVLACEIARAGFGSDLLKIISAGGQAELTEWKERLEYELEFNESGYFKKKHKSVKIPADFPDQALLHHYTHPEVSAPTELQRLEKELQGAWDGDINTTELREYVAQTFNWQYRGGACKYIRSLAPALLAQRLLRGQKKTTISSNNAILERRMHFVSDGMPELRVTAVPADIVGLNIDDEEDNPEYVLAMEEAAAAEGAVDDFGDPAEPEVQPPQTAPNISKPRKKVHWDPRSLEKIWLPETILKLGLPNLVEEWEHKQRDMLTDPKKFIANKARKINPPTAATQKTRPIQAYFATTKPSVTEQSTRASSPKKAPSDPVDHAENRNIRASSTPTRRKTKSKINEAIPPPTSSINPFSLACHSKPRTTNNNSTRLPSLKNYSEEPSTNPPINPIRPNRAPLQKSKTLPASFEEPILISSSPPRPFPSSRHPRSTKPFPPTTPPPHSLHQDQGTDIHTQNSPPLSETDSLPSPSQLLKHNKPRARPRVAKTPPPPPLTEIFRPRHADTAVPVTETLNNEKEKTRMEKKMVIQRDSLPGTWREVMDSVYNEESEEEERSRDTDGKGGRRRLPRVSLVDLTEL